MIVNFFRKLILAFRLVFSRKYFILLGSGETLTVSQYGYPQEKLPLYLFKIYTDFYRSVTPGTILPLEEVIRHFPDAQVSQGKWSSVRELRFYFSSQHLFVDRKTYGILKAKGHSFETIKALQQKVKLYA